MVEVDLGGLCLPVGQVEALLQIGQHLVVLSHLLNAPHNEVFAKVVEPGVLLVFLVVLLFHHLEDLGIEFVEGAQELLRRDLSAEDLLIL